MKRFREYLSEAEHVELSVDSAVWEPQLDKMNFDLEAVTSEPFLNSALFVNAVRGTLERYGILLPAHSNMQQLSVEAEVVYDLVDDLTSNRQDYTQGGDEKDSVNPRYLYMVHNLDPNGNVEGYAQIVNQEELDALGSMDRLSDEEEFEAGVADQDNTWLANWRKQQRHTNDDSGNTNEY